MRELLVRRNQQKRGPHADPERDKNVRFNEQNNRHFEWAYISKNKEKTIKKRFTAQPARNSDITIKNLDSRGPCFLIKTVLEIIVVATCPC